MKPYAPLKTNIYERYSTGNKNHLWLVKNRTMYNHVQNRQIGAGKRYRKKEIASNVRVYYWLSFKW